MNHTKEVAVLITVYNEEKIVGDIIKKIPNEYHVFVVDDGSTDNTAEIARRNGAHVISLPLNLGQGAASTVGYKITAAAGCKYLIKMDGDGQHDPREIPKFVERLKNSDVDVVVGSRILGSNYKGAPLARRIFLPLLTSLLNRLTGYNLTDSMCGFRAFRGESLRGKIVPIFDRIVEPEYMASEMWIRFANAGITVAEVPITLSNRKHGSSYKGLFRYGWGVISTIIRTKLDTYKGECRNNKTSS